MSLRHVVAASAATAMLVSGTAAFASHYPDVSNAHPFHADIAWMTDTGIAAGYADGNFHPADPVTRQAMSRFMKKLYNVGAGLTYVQTGSNGGSTTLIDTWYDVAGTTAVTIPAGTSGRVVATFSGDVFCNFGDNIFILVAVIRPQCQAQILRDGVSFGQVVTLDDSDDGASDPDVSIDSSGFSMQSVTGVLTAGTYNFKAQVMANDDDANADDELVADVGKYTITYTVALQDAA